MKEKVEFDLVTPGMASYPARLKEIKNYPKQLYCRGDLKILDEHCVAVIGSRTVTPYGRDTARAIADRLAGRGVTVISGMAKGIDAAAHKGALDCNGKTVAVMGSGIDVCYPSEHRELKKMIEANGLVVTEYEPGTRAEWYNFPNRNRIISGLSEMVVVVQARNRSGALITAELAAEQGREIMAVPGNINSEYNLGNNKLIKEGAMPVISVDDVLEPLGLKKVSRKEAKIQLSSTEMEIFDLLSKQGEMSIDEVCCFIGKPPSYVNPILAVMEMKGFTFSDMGKIFLANI